MAKPDPDLPNVQGGVTDDEATDGVIDEDFQDSESEDDADTELGSIITNKTITLTIQSQYAARWEPREAFRELVQNWYAKTALLHPRLFQVDKIPFFRRDGIIKAFELDEQQFCVVREERVSGANIEIVYKSFRQVDDGKEWLGYIRFKGRNNEGTIDICNRKATLQPWHLDFGGSSKVGNSNQAGAHGEGLKVALLVMMRGKQNLNVRCRTGGANWNFNFSNKKRLVARLRPMKKETIRKENDLAIRVSEKATSLLPFAVKAKGDVHFVIGEVRNGRNEKGLNTRRRPVRREEFDAWTKAALFLNNAQDGAIISTHHGDLLTQPALRGSIYLKGLLLLDSTAKASASTTNRPLRFGYNFAQGQTNRERQVVTGPNKEAKSIFAIWAAVLRTRPELAKELSDMLNDDDTHYADVYGAEKFKEEETASRLQKYLFGTQFAGKWYYCAEHESKVCHLS